MMTLSLAVRNLLRNRRRSLATLLALCIGTASILLFGGYSANIAFSMQTAYVRSGGHLQVQHRDYFLYGSGNPTAYGIADYARLMAAIESDAVLKPLVTVVTPTLQFGGIGGNFAAGVSRTVIGTGMVAPDVNRMRVWNQFDLPLDSPRFVLEGASPDAAIVGVGVARVLQLCGPLGITDCPQPEVEAAAPPPPPTKGKSGKPSKPNTLPDDIAQLALGEAANAKPQPAGHARIELLAGNANGTPNVASLNVIQAEGQGFKEFDDVAVVVHLAQAQQLVYGRAAPRATSLLVQLHRTDQMPQAAERLKALLPTLKSRQPLTVLDFETLNPFYVQTLQLFDTIFGFIYALIGAIVLFTVSNTMNTAVVERTVEIGTLRAVGLRQSGIRRMFVTEGFMLGLAGALTGVVAALLIAFIVNRLNLTWLPPGSSEPLPLILRVWGQTRMILGATVGLILIAAGSAWLPAYRAAKLNVVDALRHV
jgi:putative ABC transport system permease protein